MAKILKYQRSRSNPLKVEGAVGALSIELGDALEKYEHWPNPTAIISGHLEKYSFRKFGA